LISIKENILDNYKIKKEMEKESNNGKMEIFIKVNGKTILNKDWENYS